MSARATCTDLTTERMKSVSSNTIIGIQYAQVCEPTFVGAQPGNDGGNGRATEDTTDSVTAVKKDIVLYTFHVGNDGPNDRCFDDYLQSEKC